MFYFIILFLLITNRNYLTITYYTKNKTNVYIKQQKRFKYNFIYISIIQIFFLTFINKNS